MLTTFPPSYLYAQFFSDPNLQALVKAQNIYAQSYLDAINALNLPIYTGPVVAGSLLDWVGTGLYGIPRPVFGSIVSETVVGGPYNTLPYNTETYNGVAVHTVYAYATATDDQYRRVITWNFYKGDGWQFTFRWLKRRVLRFLTGTNGIDPGISQTYLISVQPGTSNSLTVGVDVSLSANIPLLQQALAGGFLNIPFAYAINVVVI